MHNSDNGRLFIAGEWVTSPDTAEVKNPYSNEVTGRVCIARDEHLEQATAAAQGAVADFSRLPRHVKSDYCQKIADGIAENGEKLARLITAESGKPIQYARAEVTRAATTFTIASHEALRFAGEVVPLDISAASEKHSAVTQYVPSGPVAAISPFNFPLNLVAHKIAPAIAVGCTVVLKPAPQTPLTALYLARVMEGAGVPPGAVSVLPMEIATAEKMVRDERFGTLSFTGSAAVGWQLKAIAGRKKVLLELGGNAPAIVHEDADIAYAVERLVQSSFAAAGQVCIKSQRLLVHQGIGEKFAADFVQAARRVKCGDPTSDDTVVGPVIDEKSADRIEQWINEAVEGGAKVLLEGKRCGNTIAPTILTDVPPDARCRTEEIFGPVVIIDLYGNLPEAIARANSTKYGLQAAVFSHDVRVLEQCARDLEYGGVILNDSPMFRVDNFPYGGIKQSGLGREGVHYAMREYCDIKTVILRSMI